jgi:hypothetical protein
VSLAAHTTLRHDILRGILRLVVHRAGIAFTQEFALRRLPGFAGGAGTSTLGASTRVQAPGDIFLALPGGITIADISVIHPLVHQHPSSSSNYAAAPRPGQQKQAAYARVEPNGLPFSVVRYGSLGQPAMKLLHALGDEVPGPVGVKRASFVAGALRELSVGLCRGIFFTHARECLQSPVGWVIYRNSKKLLSVLAVLSKSQFALRCTAAYRLAYCFWPQISISVESLNILPYIIPGAIWHLRPRLAFEAFTDPVDTSSLKYKLPLHPTQRWSRRNPLIQQM